MSIPTRVRLLNPGPVTLTERVRRALLGTDLCHREPEYASMQDETLDLLRRVYPEAESTHAAVLLTGSGTAAVEAMIGTLVPSESGALVVANGVYGERIAAILGAQGKRSELVRSEWTAAMDLDRVERALREKPRPSHVIAVHHETTTGRLNDVAALGRMCADAGVPLLLDAVSSFGGERVDFAGWNLIACAASANKCLHGVPGISFVIVRRDALEATETFAPGLYLDLHRYAQAQSSKYPPFTPAVQVVAALREALRELEEAGGWRNRNAEYASRSARVRRGLRGHGYDLLLESESAYSSILTSFRLPAGVDFDDLFRYAHEAGFVIYPGQKSLMKSIFRISVMGDLSTADLDELVDTLAAFPR
jgi:2-aminoethylphosphonate-pyruvate transaminase